MITKHKIKRTFKIFFFKPSKNLLILLQQIDDNKTFILKLIEISYTIYKTIFLVIIKVPHCNKIKII